MSGLGRTKSDDDWMDSLESAGFVRNLLRARKWYGPDWWLVAAGGVLALGLVVIGLVPGFFAPFDPVAEVGPRLLAPGEQTDVPVLLARTDSGIEGIVDLASDDRVSVGIERGSPWGQILRDEAERISAESSGSGDPLEIRIRIERFDLLTEALDALAADEVAVVPVSSLAATDLLSAYPDLMMVGPISGEPSEAFRLGTTQIGQDVLSRLIWGTRVALLVGFIAPLIAVGVGLPLGLIAGFVGGKVDRILTVVMDSLYVFPGLILAIAITAVLGPSILNVIIALGVIYVPTYFRVIRGQTLATKELLFVEAARSLGARGVQIMRDFIAPNVIPSAVILFSVSIADAILTGAALSFLGLGLPPDLPDWGRDLARGQGTIYDAWWLVVFPGSMITIAVLAFTMLGEGLVEIYNPRLRKL